jgi:uncharacterized protein
MQLEGVVTNVAAFGAFVDVGVHQDGLVHVSALADKFVKDPHTVVKPGQIVTVRVLEVDVKRQRIALSMRRDDARGGPTPKPTTGRAPAANASGGAPRPSRTPPPRKTPPRQPEPAGGERDGAHGHPADKPSGAMALAFARAKAKQ